MKLVPLSKTDQDIYLATHKAIITYADVAALGAATTGAFQIAPEAGTFPAGTEFRFARLKLITAFDASDAGINSLLVEVGDGGDPDRLMAQTQVAVDGTEIFEYVAPGNAYTYNAADTVDVTCTVAGGASPLLNEITSGEVEIYLWIRNTAPVKNVR